MLMNRASQRNKRRAEESGQAAVFLVLAMGLFLIGSMGFVVDGANLWFHRQSAQTAADAACTAGAMNMLSVAAGANPPSPNWIATSFQCSGSDAGGGNGPNSGFVPCQYAALNGYASSGLQANKAGTDVSVSFPGSFASMPSCSDTSILCTAQDVATTPYMQVNVTDRVQTTFIGMLNGGHTVDVGAQAICGLSNVLSPVPVVVLNPNVANGSGVSSTLQVSGDLSVLGAPKSIQVNSTDRNAVDLSHGTVDLSIATSGTGDGQFAIAGRELESDAGGSISAKWVNAAGVVSDPFATVSAPKPQGLRDCTNITDCVTYGATPGTLGCPSGVSCDVYLAGYYPTFQNCPNAINGQAAICVDNEQPNNNPKATGLALFQPGVYYLGEDFYASSNSCVRSGTTGGDGSGGTVFYLAGQGVLDVASGSGAACASSFPSVSLSDTECPKNNLTLPSITVTGNVLLAPCTGKYGDPSNSNQVRGMLFFQERDVPPQNTATWSGSSANSFALVGNIYLHNCLLNQSGDTGANCDPSAFQETLSLGSTGYIVGGIAVDQLQINAGAHINVVLNPSRQYHTLKASLLQ
jgi:putative Flp pilus-assembly TadE/G-like protein